MKILFPKRDLEIILDSLKPHPEPKAILEQYTIPAETASEILFTAGSLFDDILDRRVLDLGCGTGRLAIGASIIGAREVVGVDVDPWAVMVARNNQANVNAGRKIQWIISDIACVRGRFDTALQNPPFGVQRKGADRLFIRKALEAADVVYSLHKAGQKNRAFIKRFAKENGGRVTDLFQLKFKIPWTFSFHRKRFQTVIVDLYRMESS